MLGGLSDKFEIFLSFFRNPLFWVVVIPAMACVLFLGLSRRYKWVPYVLLLYCSTLAPALDFFDVWLIPPRPFNWLVLYGQSMTTGLLFLMLFLGIWNRLGAGKNYVVSKILISLILFQAIYCLRFALSGYLEAYIRLMLYGLTFFVLGVFFPSGIKNTYDAYSVLRAMAISAALFVTGIVYCLAVDRSAVMVNGRLFGTAYNPNQAAGILGVLFPAVLAMVRDRKWNFERFIWISVLVFMLVLVVATGSRGGVMICVVSMLVMFRSKFSSWVLLAVPLLSLVYVFVNFWGFSGHNVSRLISGGNTRADVWRSMWLIWKENPWFGSTVTGLSTPESSYLIALATMGVGGGILVAVVVFLVLDEVLRALRLGELNLEEKSLRDASVAACVAILVWGVFEAVLLGTITTPIFAMYGYANILAYVIFSKKVSLRA